MVSLALKISRDEISINASEEDASGEESAKEDADFKEEKLYSSSPELLVAVSDVKKEQLFLMSDPKMVNHSFEINSPPPNC